MPQFELGEYLARVRADALRLREQLAVADDSAARVALVAELHRLRDGARSVEAQKCQVAVPDVTSVPQRVR